MNLSSETKLFLSIIVATVVIIAGAMFFFGKQAEKEANPTVFKREELMPPGTPTQGNASASAYLVEFSDFQCPACKSYQPFVNALVSKYYDKLTFGYRHFPLTQHPYAEKAAWAAEAAGKQGKFWEFEDELFGREQEKFSDDMMIEIVKKLSLNEETFKKDWQDAGVKEKVSKDQQFGTQIGVNSTPSFFLNGKKITANPQDLDAAVANAITP